MDANGEVIQTYSTKPNKEKNEQSLSAKQGLNRFLWNMRYPNAESFSGLVLWAGGTSGPAAIPGEYTAKLTVGKTSHDIKFEIVKDPRSRATDADFQAQLDFLLTLRDKLSETHLAIKKIRTTRDQVNAFASRMKKLSKNDKKLGERYKPVLEMIDGLVEKITAIEEELYQTKNQSPQDPLNFPIRLNNKLSALAGVVSTGDYPPTKQATEVYAEISGKIDVELKALNVIFDKEVSALNQQIQKLKVPAILVD